MRIHSELNIPQAADTGSVAKPGSPSVAASGDGGLAPDTSKLTSSAANVLVLAAAVSQFPEVRQAKVAALAQQVRGGSYQPPADQSAEALMSNMLLPTAA